MEKESKLSAANIQGRIRLVIDKGSVEKGKKEGKAFVELCRRRMGAATIAMKNYRQGRKEGKRTAREPYEEKSPFITAFPEKKKGSGKHRQVVRERGTRRNKRKKGGSFRTTWRKTAPW